jgi:1-phosphofructokinase family hexose kinase
LILTVTLNAAVDKTYRIERFTLDRVHRPTEWRIVAGGKGINLARVYQSLGGRALTTGFLGGYNGRFIARSLQEEGIAADFVKTREESRVCIAVVDPLSNTQTEINEIGPHVTPGEIRSLKKKFEKLVRSHSFDFVTLSGSIPPGTPDGIYAELIEIGKSAGMHCVLDASGEALKIGVHALPWMVKPNIFEMETLIGHPLRDDEEIAQAALSVMGTGIEVVCVTQGRRGCICASEKRLWKAIPPEVEFVSAVGSGDSLLGAFLWALSQGWDVSAAVTMGVSAGAANASVYGSGFCTAEQIFHLAKSVQLSELSVRMANVSDS